MEWTRIEAKWHDMARRLQQGDSSFQETSTTASNAVNRSDRNIAPDAVLRIADAVEVRPEV